MFNIPPTDVQIIRWRGGLGIIIVDIREKSEDFGIDFMLLAAFLLSLTLFADEIWIEKVVF